VHFLIKEVQWKDKIESRNDGTFSEINAFQVLMGNFIERE
jgi:hypothetical protein